MSVTEGGVTGAQERPKAPESCTVGWIGLGDQGLPLVRRLLSKDVDTVVWARRSASLEPLRGTAARTAASPADLAVQCDHVGICVTADRDVIEVALDSGLLGAMRPGTTLAVHSTVRPTTCEYLNDMAVARDVAILDAPVTRNGASQYGSEFSLLVGGDREAVERARPVFSLYADHVIHLGELGSGQRMKVINNALAVANLRLIFDALSVGIGIGLDEAAMIDTLRHASGGSVMVDLVQFYRPSPRADYVRLFKKDINLFEAVATSVGPGAAPTLSAAARSMITELTAALDSAG